MKNEKLLRAMGNIGDELITNAMPGRAEQKPRRFRRGLVVALAAALALTLTIGVGAASGAFGGLKDVFAPAFRNDGTAPPPDMEIIEKLGRPVGVSAVDQGVTVTVESVLRDRYTCTIVTSVKMDGLDGNEIDFDRMEMGGVLENHVGGSGCTTDVVPDDDTIQVVRTWESDEPIPQGTAAMTIDTVVLNRYRFLRERAIEGKWELEFDASYEDLSRDLPAGQTLTVEGADVTLNEITVSPLSCMIKHTVDPKGADLKRVVATEPYERTLQDRLEGLECVITKKDGTRFSNPSALLQEDSHTQNSTHRSREQDGKLECYSLFRFDQMLPLDEIQSITIEGVEIPLS